MSIAIQWIKGWISNVSTTKILINVYLHQDWNHPTLSVANWSQQSQKRAELNWRRPSLNARKPVIRNFLLISVWPETLLKIWALGVEVSLSGIILLIHFYSALFLFIASANKHNNFASAWFQYQLLNAEFQSAGVSSFQDNNLSANLKIVAWKCFVFYWLCILLY